ncbi:hypothetical protein BDS110ZK25_25910 [Bradyrhizobium diazoefficiens]
MLSAVLAAWLGLWGPIDLSRLEKWQTLMTGFVAIIAAGIAYRGATAKVRFDQEVLAAESMRRKLALYLKVEIALTHLAERAWWASARFGHSQSVQHYTRRDFALDEPPELEEAWASLDYFPRPLIAEIRNVRKCLREFAAIKADFGEGTISWDPLAAQPWVVHEGHRLAQGVCAAAFVVVQGLKPLIDQLAPQMDQDEKMTKVFGKPEDIPF